MYPKKPVYTHTHYFLLVAILAATWLLTTFKIKTYDIWLQIIGGKLWLENPTLVMRDHLSFSVPDIKFVNQEWLCEVFSYIVYNTGGLTLMIAVKSLFICFMIYMFFKHMMCRGSNVWAIFWILLLTLFLCRFRLTVRPQIFTFVFVTYLGTQLHGFKIGKHKNCWILLPMIFFWTNFHFGSIIGLIIIGTYLGAACMARYIPNLFDGNLKHPVSDFMVKHLAFIFISACLIALINPATYHFYTMPLEATYMALKYRVIECLPPRMLPYGLFPLFWISMVLYITIIFTTIRRIDIFDLLLFLMAATLAFKMVRFIALFAIISAPIIIQQITIFLQHNTYPKALVKICTNRILTALISCTLIGCVVSSQSPQLKKFQFGYGAYEEILPTGAVNFIKTNKIKGNIFNDINWGGYLAHELYPDNKIFMHGRYTVFGDVIYETYYRVLAGTPEWATILSQYNADLILLSRKLGRSSPLLALISASPNWELVYVDNQSMLYIRNKEEFKDIIQIFRYNTSVVRSIE